MAAATVVVVALATTMEDAPQHNNSTGDRPTCQLCGKEGHTVLCYHKCFDASFTGLPENRFASTASTSYYVDTNWYTDISTIDHITSELDKLTVRDKYYGTDQVHNANGACMRINQIDQSFVHTPKRDLVLNNVLYVRKLVRILHRFIASHLIITFIEFHPNYFLVKDQIMKKILLRGNLRRWSLSLEV